MTIADAKAALRSAAYAARKTAHEQAQGSTAIAALMAELGPLTGCVISGYMPIRTEIDPLPAMAALAERNKICVPVIEAPGKALMFRHWHPGADMIEGPFKALIPAAGDWLEPDVLIVPLVGFDAQGNRLGYGGGFYDRTLAGLRARKTIRAIGFAYSAQRLPELPVEATDQRLDAIVTETGVIRPF